MKPISGMYCALLCITVHYIAQTLEVVSVVADPCDTLFVKYVFIYEGDEARQGSGLCNIRNTRNGS